MKLPQLFIDQDGVIANLDAHYYRHFGKSNEHPGAFSAEEFWGSVNSVENFWRTIPPFDGTLAFWGRLRELHPNPVILTTISNHELAGDGIEEQKREWIAEHLGPDVTVIVCRGKDKRLHCRTGDILVDDWTRHEKPWIERGGHFIHHRSFTDTICAVDRLMDAAKRKADQAHSSASYDGTYMCELHHGEPFQHGGCSGRPVPWVIIGKTAILSALKERTP